MLPARNRGFRAPNVVVGALIFSALFGACAELSAHDPTPQNMGIEIADTAPRTLAETDAVALASVVKATRAAGVAMIKDSPGENVIVSPSSFVVALSMLSEGAKGQTLTELESVIGASGEQRRDALVALRSALAPFEGDPALVKAKKLPQTPMVHLASQVIVDDNLEANPSFLSALSQVYGAGLQHTDLGSSAGKHVLDTWVKQNSGGLIQKSAIEPQPELLLVLQDAIVLAAKWAQPFATYATADRPFTLATGKEVDTPTMQQMAQFAFAEVKGWQAVRLPYTGAELHADFILPPLGTDPATATAKLLSDLNTALTKAKPEMVSLSVPVLDIKPEMPLDLLSTIASLGAPTVLDKAKADLSGIGTSAERLFLGQGVQQAILQVDEEGTRAAAVTEFGVVGSGAPVPAREVNFDRPFAIVVAHTDTSWPLFQAAIRDPRP
jgi:serine protease inhibitor